MAPVPGSVPLSLSSFAFICHERTPFMLFVLYNQHGAHRCALFRCFRKLNRKRAAQTFARALGKDAATVFFDY